MYKDHADWKPVKKLYYKKYYNVVRVGAKSARHRLSIPIEFSGEYRIVDRIDGIKTLDDITVFSSVASVYTNNTDLMDYLLDEYYVVGIETPYNNQHKEYLVDQNRNVIYRDKAWYGTYHHKVKVYETWRHRGHERANPAEVLKSFKELFVSSDSRWNGQHRDLTEFSSSRYFAYPTVYTNNEPSIMLLKMLYNQTVAIYVETVVTPDFLK